MNTMLMHWIGHLFLRNPTPEPEPEAQDRQALEDALRAAQEAEHTLRMLERRARAVGIDVDVQRSWGPRGER